ncbi:MAG TPA: hypothetical protein VJJ83_04505, partial [Candidatus Babeliales bacterium]|nr:hypothetical protein [Candidatus Babeliales bacterium]
MPITASTIQITMDGQALTLPTTAHGITALDNSADPKYTPGGEITTPAFQSSIKASDLVTPLANSANMYTINRSGRYYVANDLSRTNPNQFTGCTMLYINSSDVTLDLNGKTIRASQFVNASTLTAIKIAANLSNITIRNGTINGFNSLAASPTTQYITTGIDATAGTNKNLSLCDLQVINIGGNGVTITSNQDLLIQNVTISNCLNAGDIKALFLTNCNSVKVLNCNFNNVSSSGGPAHGVYATGCNTLLFDGCTAAEIGLNNSNDNNARGFNTSTTKDVTFLNCTATRITATRTSGTPDAIGFKLESSGYGPFKLVNCTSSQGAGAIVYGFYAEATGAYSDCDADSNASTSGLCHGFSLTGAPGSKLT